MFQFRSNRISLDPSSDIQIVGVTFGQMEEAFGLVIDLLNMSPKEIDLIKVDVLFINAMGKFIFDKTSFSHSFTNLSISPQSICYLDPWKLDERHQTARSALIRISEVHFSDGSRKYFKKDKENVYTLPIVSEEKLQRLQGLFGRDIITYANKLKDAWRCACGAVNPSRRQECKNCQRNRDFVLATLTERRINEKLYSLLKNDKEEEMDFAILSHQSSHIVEDIRQLEAKRKKIKEEIPGRTLSLRRKIFLGFASLLALIFLYFSATFIYQKLDTRNNLIQAENSIRQGKYKEALDIYKDMSPHANNVDMALKIEDTQNLIKSQENYNKGVQLTIEDNNLSALYAFSKVIPDDNQNYAKSQAMISSLKQDFILNIENHRDQGQLNEALKEAENLLAILPDENEVKTLRDQVLQEMGR